MLLHPWWVNMWESTQTPALIIWLSCSITDQEEERRSPKRHSLQSVFLSSSNLISHKSHIAYSRGGANRIQSNKLAKQHWIAQNLYVTTISIIMSIFINTFSPVICPQSSRQYHYGQHILWATQVPLGPSRVRDTPLHPSPKPITLPEAVNCQFDPNMGTQPYLIPQSSLEDGGVEVGCPSQAKPCLHTDW